MKKHQLEHLIRAAGSITGCPEVYVVGSQAILATVSSGPPELFLSGEADVFVDGRPDLSDLIEEELQESVDRYSTRPEAMTELDNG